MTTMNIPTGVDQEIFQEMQELMEDDFPLLLQTFLEDTPELLKQINEAVSGDLTDQAGRADQVGQLGAAAHQLKSTSASLGFTALEQLADQLEEIGNGTDAGEAAALCQQANTSYGELAPFLTEQLDS